jgi:hypothetical protein
MEWDNKVKMIQLGNKRDVSDDAKKEFQSYVLENIKMFDTQSWEMFCELVDLVVDEMIQDIEFWKKVYSEIKNVDCNQDGLRLRSRMRIALIQTICEDRLKLV